jgi:hypothetical protein
MPTQEHCFVEKGKSHRKHDLVSQRWADGTKGDCDLQLVQANHFVSDL